jgi:hypothetical protein
MTTLTASTTFSVGASSTVVETVTTTILAAVAAGSGRGRLVHPTLGTYDYSHMPDQWVNVDSDVIIAPIWANARTLDGAANTLWQGSIRDVEVEERWTFAVPVAHLRTILSYWQNPPDPDDGYVSWYPNYANGNGYQVLMLNVSVGGEGVMLNWVSRRHSFVIEDMALRMRIVARL